jgi:osmotically-inducible protein OsmY
MSQRAATWLLLAAGVLVVAAGCTREPEDTNRTAEVDRSAEVSQDLQDTWITTKIQAKYFADADVKGRNIDVTTNNGVVTLQGVVEDERAHQQAVAIARNTDDVVDVRDQLVAEKPVEPATVAAGDSGPRADVEVDDDDGDFDDQVSNAWITTKIQAKYFVDAIVKGRNIDVTTNNGAVTLEGHVGSQTEKDHAVHLARDTDGVRRVEDRLVVETSLARLDDDKGELTDVETSADSHPSESALPPTQPVAEPAPGSQSALSADAPPPAVGTTEPLSGDRPATGAEDDERMTDAGITTRIQSKFFLDDQVKPEDIEIETTNRVVTLSGEVGNQSQKERALSLARSVHGVVDVKDDLTLAGPGSAESAADRSWEMPAGALGDSWITT